MFSLDNEEIVELAMEGFQEIGPESLHWLHDALDISSETIRSNAARALGKMKSHASTPYLLELLKTRAPRSGPAPARPSERSGTRSASSPWS
jgi:HEAT repeat protein